MSTPRKSRATASSLHAWAAVRHETAPVSSLQIGLVAMAEQGAHTRLSRLSDRVVNSAGSASSMRKEFDAFIWEHLARGFMPLSELGSKDLEQLGRHLGITPPATIEACMHLHVAADPWGRAAAGIELQRMAADENTCIFLRPPGERYLLCFDPQRGAQLINRSPDGPTDRKRALALAESLIEAGLPSLTMDLAVTGPAIPALLVDLLSYDGNDLRTHPFVERRALIKQIHAELVGTDSHGLKPLTEALPEQTALRATALIDRRAPYGAWRQGR